ncbi:3-deoxy-manno-octulosonate cytidylyltransferase [Algimonas porphyrae]|uniref:3-deoxy-manno-octulosonate cytidylyltransferase n=1 Tax=Algimonas porphyrae TaxID=1128113 RepID=A0ABQ5V2S0_9PROT|nr:manno-octulosonate cytidylyltransferase [Algimonas porphyrae]GLQ20527.1 3-deoxy-manno-octulosonate cytidylyltransferase [Algimonas porphyrae]
MIAPAAHIRTLIVIPARYGSTRFPGKPLAEIGGKSMLRHTAETADVVARAAPGRAYVVATDDDRIRDHCEAHDLPVVMTDPDCPSGSDRAMAACHMVAPTAEIIVNLQGDAPFTPPDYIEHCLANLADDPEADMATPVVPLDWAALDQLRADKRTTPFSGTTAIIDGATGRARWFSKTIIPAIRKEEIWRQHEELSPVLRHVGLYAYRRAALEQFMALAESPYERTEGLEQLRALEAGMIISCARVDPAPVSLSGIDTPEDLARAEALLAGMSH